MTTTNLKVDLSKQYITEPIGKDALAEIIKGDNSKTAHRLYLIVNELKERYYFQELDDHDKYTITAAVNVRYTYAGEARRQIESLPLLRPLLKNTNGYEIVYKVFLKKKKLLPKLLSNIFQYQKNLILWILLIYQFGVRCRMIL